jgi:hypothetical protein
MAVQSRSGVISISAFAMLLVGTISGAVVGLLISGGLEKQVVLAIICALAAAILALVTGRLTLGENTGISSAPGVAVWNIAIAALIGGLAGHELSVDLREPPGASLVGGLSGLLASIMIVSAVVTVFILRVRQSAAER